jgi:hypothetical protein
MVSDAEKYKAEDEEAAARIGAKNGLESYAYNLRNSVEGDLADKLEADDKEKLNAAIKETTEWLDASAEASKVSRSFMLDRELGLILFHFYRRNTNLSRKSLKQLPILSCKRYTRRRVELVCQVLAAWVEVCQEHHRRATSKLQISKRSTRNLIL